MFYCICTHAGDIFIIRFLLKFPSDSQIRMHILDVNVYDNGSNVELLPYNMEIMLLTRRIMCVYMSPATSVRYGIES